MRIKELADAAEARRRFLALSQRDMANRSKQVDVKGKGLSLRTVTNLLSASGERPHPRTVGLLDRTLAWPQGTSRRILDGGAAPDPDAPVEPTASRIDTFAAPVTDDGEVVVKLIIQHRCGSCGGEAITSAP